MFEEYTWISVFDTIRLKYGQYVPEDLLIDNAKCIQMFHNGEDQVFRAIS